jgi:two-component system nitrogen regulation sensor histidine kinase NtrY
MHAGAEPASQSILPLKRRLSVTPAVELGVLAAVLAVALASYFIVRGEGNPKGLLAPPVIALVLVANLAGGIALMMLAGRRIARRRAARSPVGGEGRLHVRLVLLFSAVAAVPALLVTIFASLLFQYGVQFWYSDRARSMFENAASLAQENYRSELNRVAQETATMSSDLANYLRNDTIDSKRFSEGLAYQLYLRNLSEALIVNRAADGELRTLALLNPYDRPLERVVTPAMVAKLERSGPTVIVQGSDRAGALTRLDYQPNTYLYSARVFDPQLSAQIDRGAAVLGDYRQLLERARSLQLRFNAALLIISLLIVGIAVWIALQVADRLVRPVGELVEAARRVADGDLAARVSDTRERDEVGVLSNAFNAMTSRIETQNTALVTANTQLESRRALIEAVMSGVSAGVLSIAEDRTIRLINSSAQTLLGLDTSPIGRPLASVAPELDALLTAGAREGAVQVSVAGEQRTFAARVARDGSGPIVTFDDITQQLTDQRRAAWADVARRIAHEIKNPLTPIQLAAERLQRRYGGKVEEGDTTFARLTDTIVRQVGDLRRMVDEFSSFARMPKPVFRHESLLDVARQTMFLHEVAHPRIHFTLDHDDPAPALVCDRRQLGQALTNVVKNAVEAVEAADRDDAAITMSLIGDDQRVTISVADTGVGLPAERERIVEPYMTTRARGTGLGLAIVKKIVEEHHGSISFDDRPGGGTIVTLSFEPALLEPLALDDEPDSQHDDRTIAALTRSRN